MKLIAVNWDGDSAVLWFKSGRWHRIEYAEQVKEFKNDSEAAHEFGECVRHSLECAGKLD